MGAATSTHIVYAGLGYPAPHETSGDPIPARGSGGPCAHCGAPGNWRLDQAISSNFTTVKNGSRAWPFGGRDVCAACLMACKSLRLRCALWFARESGIWHVPTRPWIVKGADGKGHAIPGTRVEALDSLLNPPPVPFVAGWPRMGISKGGEQNIERVYAPGRPVPATPLIKIQSKHVAIYAQVATSRDRYPLQVDDVHDVVVDVSLWSEARAACYRLLGELRSGGVGQQECVAALLTMRAPPSAPLSVHRGWRALTTTVAPHHRALWWPFFVELLRMPALVKRETKDPKEGTHAQTRERDRAKYHRKDDHERAKAARVPAARHADPDAGRGLRGGALQLGLF